MKRWNRGIRLYGNSPLLPLTVAVMALVGLTLMPDGGLGECGIASAANGQLPSDYCYVVPISFALSNSATSTQTDVAVRIPPAQGFNASGLIGSNLMDAQVWDMRPTTSGSQETDVFAQDLTDDTAPWWFHIPSAAPNTTVVINLYFKGVLTDIQRDQGLLFTGGDSVTVAHHADFNIADSLTLHVGLEMLNVADAQTATLVTHRNGSVGYSLSLVDSSGLAIRSQVDSVTCTLSWPAAITADENGYIDFTYTSPTSTITVYDSDGTQAGTTSCGGGPASITATSTAFTVGSSLNQAIVRDVKLLSGSATNLHWGFNPASLTEVSSTNPTYTGTVTDESPQGHNGTYSLSRDQTNWEVTIGGVRLVSAGGAIPPTPVTSVNLLGSDQFGFGLGLTVTPEAASDSFSRLFGATVDAYEDEGGNRTFAWTLFFVTAAVGFLVIAWTAFHFTPIAITFAGVPLVFGLTKGYIPPWVVVIWAVFTILAWFAVRRSESSGA